MLAITQYADEPPVAELLLSSQMLPLTEAGIDWEDRSYHKMLTCVNHSRVRLSTKNPWDRTIFVYTGIDGNIFSDDCICPLSDLRVVNKR